VGYCLLLLFREREEAIKGDKLDSEVNKNVSEHDTVIASSVNETELPDNGMDNKEDENAIKDEDCDEKTMSMDSEGKQKMAELEEKERLLRAHFDETNSVFIEGIENMKAALTASQEKETAINQDVDEMKMKYENLKEDLTRLDKITRRREREEIKWRKKMDQKLKKSARRLEKVRAERLLHQEEIEEEKAQSESQNNDAQELANVTGKKCIDTPRDTKDASRKDLNYSTEVTEYSSVKELEKKRRELRRLEKLEKEVMKREKLERKERRKIEKQKRRVKRKLEEMKVKESVEKDSLGVSNCDNVELSDALISAEHDKPDELVGVCKNKQQGALIFATFDAEEVSSEASSRESELKSPAEKLLLREVHEDNQNSKSCGIKDGEIVTAESFLSQAQEDQDDIILEEIPECLDPEIESESGEQRSLKFENNAVGSSEGSADAGELKENNSEESAAPNYSEGQQNLSLNMQMKMRAKDTTDDVQKEDCYKEMSEDLIRDDIQAVEESDDQDIDESSPVFNKPAPLTRKQSCIFTPFGLTPFFHSLKNPSDNEIPEKIDSSFEGTDKYQLPFEKALSLPDHEETYKLLDASVDCILEELSDVPRDNIMLPDKETSEKINDNFNVSSVGEVNTEQGHISNISVNEDEDIQDILSTFQLTDGFTSLTPVSEDNNEETTEEKSWNDESELHISDLPEGLQEALMQKCMDCTGDLGAGKIQVQLVYEEVILRSFDPNSSIVCEEEVSPQHSNLFGGSVEQVSEEELEDDSSIKEPLSNDQRFLPFVHHCDEKGQPKKQFVRDDEDVSQLEQSVEYEVSLAGDDELSCCEEVSSVREDDNDLTKDIEVSVVHGEEIDYIEDVISVEESAPGNHEVVTEDVEVSTAHSEDVDFIENVIYEEDVELVAKGDNIETNAIEVSAVRDENIDNTEDLMSGDDSVVEDDTALTEDIEVSTVHEGDLEFLEGVMCEEEVESFAVDDDLQIEDIEVSSDHDEDLDFIEDVMAEEDSVAESDYVHTEDDEVSTVDEEDLDYIEDVVCVLLAARNDTNVADKGYSEDKISEVINSEEVKPSPPATNLCPSSKKQSAELVDGVHSSASIEGKNSKEQEFIDEFDELLDQVEEEMSRKDLLSHISFCEKEKCQDESRVDDDDKSPEIPLSIQEDIEDRTVPVNNVLLSDSSPQVDDKILVVTATIEPSKDKTGSLGIQLQYADESAEERKPHSAGDTNEEIDSSWGSFCDLLPPLSSDAGVPSFVLEHVDSAVNMNKGHDEREAMHSSELRLAVEDVTADIHSVAEAKAPFAYDGQDNRVNQKLAISKGDAVEFIDDFDRYLDDVEEDIRFKEYKEYESNSYSSISDKDKNKVDDDMCSSADEDSVQETITSVSDASFTVSSLSSSDQEVPAARDGDLSVIFEEDEKDYLSSGSQSNVLIKEDPAEESFTSVSQLIDEEVSMASCEQEVTDIKDCYPSDISEDEDDDPDSWDALDNLTLPCCRTGKCSSCLNTSVVSKESNTKLLVQSSLNRQKSLAALKNISEYLLQEMWLDAFKAATANTRDVINSNAAQAIVEEIQLNKEVSSERKELLPKGLKQSKEELIGIPDEQRTLCKANKKLQASLEAVERRNKALKEIVHFTNKEKEKLLDQVISMKEEAKTLKMETQSLQNELEAVKRELKHLKAGEEYKERELANLRDDIERKEQRLENVEDELDYAQMDCKDLLYDVDSLKDKLERSEQSNLQLNRRVDELKVVIKELKATANLGNNEHDYGYLREEVEQLKGSLDLSKHHEEMLECQLDGLEKDFNNLRGRKEEIISNYKQQIFCLLKKNSKMEAELSKLSDTSKDELCNELIMKEEQTKILKQLQDQLGALEKDNSKLNEELNAQKMKSLGKEKDLSELKKETTRVIEQLQGQLFSLETENTRMTAELSKVSEKDNQLNELKEEKARITVELEDQLSKLNKENSRLMAELSMASNKDKQLSELQDEKIKITVEFQTQLSKLEKEKSTMVAEMSKISHKDNQIKELLEQLENVRNQNKFLQDEALETKQQLVDKIISPEEPQEQVKCSRTEHRNNKNKIRKLKKRIQQKEQEIARLGRFIQQGGLNTTEIKLWHAQYVKQQKDMEKKLQGIEQQLQKKERELDETKKGLRIVTGTTEALKRCVEEMENCVEDFFENSTTCNSDISSLPHDSRHENLNDSANLDICVLEDDGARELARNKEEEDGVNGLVVRREEDDGSQEPKTNTENEVGNERLSVIAEEDTGSKGPVVNKEERAGHNRSLINRTEEAGPNGLSINTDDNKEDAAGQNGLSINTDNNKEEAVGHNGLSKNTDDNKEDEPGYNRISFHTGEETGFNLGLTMNAEEGSKVIEFQLVHLNQLLKDSAEDVQYLSKTLRQERERWRQKRWQGTEEEVKWLRIQLCTKEAEMEQLTNDSIEYMHKLHTTIKALEGELESTKIALKEKTDALDRTDEKLQLQTSLVATAEEKHEEVVKQLQIDLECAQSLLKEKTDALEQAKDSLQLLTSLLATREEKNEELFKHLQENLDCAQISLKEKTDALERTEEKLQLQTSLLATAEKKHEEIIKHLQEDLECAQFTLKEKTDGLKQTEEKLQLQASLLAAAEEKQGETVKKLQEDLKFSQFSLGEKTDALQQTEETLQIQTSLVATAEEKYKKVVKQLKEDLESTKTSLKKKTDAIVQTDEKLQLETSLLVATKEKYQETVKKLQKDLEFAQISLKEKAGAFEQRKENVQTQTPLLSTKEKEHEEIVKQLQEDLECAQSSLKEKTDALKQTEENLQIQRTLIATKDQKHKELVKQYQEDLEHAQISIKEKTDELRQMEGKLQIQTSLLATTEEKYDGIVKQLQEDRKRAKISLNEKTDALRQTEEKFQTQKLLLATREKKHEETVKQLEGDLKRAQTPLKEKQGALEEAQANLRLEHISSVRDNEHEGLRSVNKDNDLKLQTMVKRLKGDLEKLQLSLKQKTAVLEQTQIDLQLKTSLLDGADSSREYIVKQLKDELQRAQDDFKERKVELEKARLDIQSKSSLITSLKAKLCLRENELEDVKLAYKGRELELERVTGSLNERRKAMEISDIFLVEQNKELVSLKTRLNWKNRHIQKMKLVVEPTQDELKLLSAELGRAKSEKAKLLREVSAATMRLEEEKKTAYREKSALREMVNSALEELEEKTKLIWDLRMKNKESRIRISSLETEKRGMEECEREYKENITSELNWLRQALKASEEKNEFFQSKIVSAKQENSELIRENHRLKIEVLQKETDEMSQYREMDVSSRPLTVRHVLYSFFLNLT